MINQSLSDLWRENKSKDPGTDLASILSGARIIAQSLKPDTEVLFSGVEAAQTDRQKIFLSPKELGGTYPVPGEVVDRLLGLTVHEMGHVLFSKDKESFTRGLVDNARVYSRQDFRNFKNFINVFEDIYVDHLMSAYPGYRDYLYRERVWALGTFNPDSIIKPLENKCTKIDMVNALVYFALAGGKLPQNITQDNMQILGKILEYARNMCTKKVSKQTAILTSWKILQSLPTTLTDDERGFTPIPTPSQTPEAKPTMSQVEDDARREQQEQDRLEKQDNEQDEDETGKETETVQAETTEEEEQSQETGDIGGEEEKIDKDEGEVDTDIEAGDGAEAEGPDTEDMDIETDLDLASSLDTLVDDKTKLDDMLAEDVRKAIVEKRADVTQLVSCLAKDSKNTIIIYTPEENAERAANARSRTSVVEEQLRRILQDYRLRRTKDYRGLMAGRVSSRRLHRVAYGDQRVFQRREKPEEIDLGVCLVMDLSGSVHPHQELIEQITCAICDTFQKEKVEFIAMGYSESGGTVYIPRLYDKEVGRTNLKLEKEWVNTPSYEGLAAAIAQLLRLTGNKQKVLFHFTDGHPNRPGPQSIPELLRDARAKGIFDIHICLGDITDLFRAHYGENVVGIDTIEQLPNIMDVELRKMLSV